jgi:acyl carrier protein
VTAQPLELPGNQAEIGAEGIELWCIDYIARILNLPREEIDPTSEFQSLGLDSALATAMIIDLEEWLDIDIPPAAVFEQVTVTNLAADLAGKLALKHGVRKAS